MMLEGTGDVYFAAKGSHTHTLVTLVNPLVPSAHKTARVAKFSILKLEGIIKKFPTSVATMSR